MAKKKELYEVSGHVCRVCLGRVLVREDEQGDKHARCARCGAVSDGGYRSLCACGTKLRNGKNAGLRCTVNPDKRPELPDEIVVMMEEDIE